MSIAKVHTRSAILNDWARNAKQEGVLHHCYTIPRCYHTSTYSLLLLLKLLLLLISANEWATTIGKERRCLGKRWAAVYQKIIIIIFFNFLLTDVCEKGLSFPRSSFLFVLCIFLFVLCIYFFFKLCIFSLSCAYQYSTPDSSSLSLLSDS